MRSNDPVLLSFLVALLDDEGVSAVVFDAHTSVLEGSIGAIPRRLMVSSDDYSRARRIIEAAGHGHVLVDAKGQIKES